MGESRSRTPGRERGDGGSADELTTAPRGGRASSRHEALGAMTADEPGWEGLRDLVARAVALTKPDRPVERRLATTERDLEDRPPPLAPKLGASGDTDAAAPGAGRAGLVEAPREAAGSDPTSRPTTGRPRPSTPTSRRAGSRKPKAALPEHGPRGTAVDGPADRAAGRPFQGEDPRHA